MTKLSSTLLPRTALLVLAMVSAVAPVAAAPDQSQITVEASRPQSGDAFTRVVSYRDLNLTSEEGRDALKLRVKLAARDGCQDLYSREPMYTTYIERGMCQRSSIADAMPRVERAISLAQAGRDTGEEVAVLVRR